MYPLSLHTLYTPPPRFTSSVTETSVTETVETGSSPTGFLASALDVVSSLREYVSASHSDEVSFVACGAATRNVCGA